LRAETVHDEFADLHARTREKLSSLAHDWAEGLYSPAAFAAAMDEALLDAHSEAVVLGRIHAGDLAPEDADDARFAAQVVESEHEFLREFVQDLDHRYTGEDGVRDGDAAAKRAEMYADRITGTANEAWGLTMAEDVALTWTLGADDDSTCTDCPELAEASPYTPQTLPTYPGKAETLCGRSCRCMVATEAGQRGFVTPG
jgi:hypothetical protein